MYSVEVLQAPNLLLENLIEDTFNDKVQWESTLMNYGKKSTAIIDILDTHKCLRFDFYEMGTASYINTKFIRGDDWLDIVEFESINATKERERLARLGQAIRRQIDSRSSSKEYEIMKRQKLISEIKRIFREELNELDKKQ